MKNIIETAVPGREERLQAGTAFCGPCRELKKRLGMKNNGCLNQCGRRFSQTFGCQLTLSLGMLNSLRRTVVITHGPVGCGFWSLGGVASNRALKQLRDPGSGGLIWISSNLDEADVIGGGEDKLREAVIYADREFRPEAIVVASSCVPALIGDDVDSILEDMAASTAADLVAVNCEGFKTKLMATAYDAVYNGLLKGLTWARERESGLLPGRQADRFNQADLDGLVNVFNVGSMSRADEVEIERLLKALDLTVNFIPSYAEPNDFRKALEASLNVSVCGTHDDYYLTYVQDKFGIPCLIDTMPIGRKATARWLRKIAGHFKREAAAERLIAREDADLDRALRPYREYLRGKRAYVSGGEVRIFVTAEALRDLGLELAGLKAHHIDAFARPVFDDLDPGDDLYINVASQQPFEQANLIERFKPDVIVMHSGGGNITARHGRPVLPLFGQGNTYLGYAGLFEMACRLKRLLANYSFNRNMKKYRPLPYREEWYQKEPFAYIVDPGAGPAASVRADQAIAAGKETSGARDGMANSDHQF
ncbi:MAG: nitrogenase [Candidatus Adiutrix sp.]|nr:nitrogenase [Candidatus Adiutrix sp.]